MRRTVGDPPSSVSGHRRAASFRPGSSARRLPAGEPPLDDLAQHGEWQRSAVQHRVVERTDVEAFSLPLTRLGAKTQQLHLADLVGERLGRPGDVSVHLVGDVVLAESSVLGHERDRL